MLDLTREQHFIDQLQQLLTGLAMYYHRQEFLKIVYHMHDKLAMMKRYLMFRSRETIQLLQPQKIHNWSYYCTGCS